MDRTELQAAANYYLMRKALCWLEGRIDVTEAVLKQVDALNAEKCCNSGGIVCEVSV
jgi:hypothetical protein